MQTIETKNLKVGDRVLFQLTHWSPSNLHFVEILFVGKSYVVMHNIERNSECCVRIDVYNGVYGDPVPAFYVSEELQ